MSENWLSAQQMCFDCEATYKSEIVLCPLHAATSELLRALSLCEITIVKSGLGKREDGLYDNADNLLMVIRKAISQTERKDLS